MSIRRNAYLVLVIIVCLGAAGVAGAPSIAYSRYLDKQIGLRAWDDALKVVEEARTTNYGAKNAVLYELDKGSVLHFAGRFQESDREMDLAETRMEELYTKSISQATGTVLVNDATQDYAGEPHEKALLNLFRALNYVALQRTDDALVECRKASDFLSRLGEKVGVRTYKQDGFVQLLSSMLFEDGGKMDDARISKAAAADGYRLYARDFGVETPQFGRLQRSANEGELVLIHYNGKVPLRKAKKSEVPAGPAPTVREMSKGATQATVTVALPVIEPQDYDIRGSEVVIGDARATTVPVEPIAQIVTQTLADEIEAIKTRSMARAGSKTAATSGAGLAAGALNSSLGSLVSASSKSLANAVEGADTRAWTALPAEIRMARSAVRSGVYSVHVSYLDSDHMEVEQETIDGVEITAGYRTYVFVRTAK